MRCEMGIPSSIIRLITDLSLSEREFMLMRIAKSKMELLINEVNELKGPLTMEKEHVTGKIDELKGKAKQGIGQATDDPEMQGEGVIDEAKGKVKQAFGDVKDAIKGADKAAGSDINDK